MSAPHPTIRPQTGILDIALYQGGDSRLPGQAQVLKLSSNENPFGPGAAARDAFRDAAQSLHLYPNSDHATLRAAIARTYGLETARVICGAGSDEIITFLCQAYAGPGREVVHTEHCFGMHRISALAASATPVAAPQPDRRTSVDALLAATTGRTALVFVANPDNPTGMMLSPAEIGRLAAGLPPQALLVLDSAYLEYAADPEAHVAIVEARDNVVMTRTFSKIHGLGGLRVGWGYGPAHVIDVLNRVRGPFNLSTAQLATAEAAVLDTGHAGFSRAETARNRAWLAAELDRLDVPTDPSEANFLLARFRDAEAAGGCDAALRERGIIVRRTTSFGLPHCLRITVGDESACRRVVAAVAEFVRVRA